MRYYFLGVCGTAMASLAVLLKQKGHQVWGTDQNIYPPMSDFLKENKINVWEGFRVDHLKTPFDVAIIGNALSRGNPEIEAMLNRRLPFASLPETIRKEFAQPLKSIVVTGTHGKTTTTALMGWVLDSAGLSPTLIIGGISENLKTSAKNGNGEFFVIEGDEYDSAFFDKRPKFLHYLPHYLIINNIEFDHSDIYRNIEQIKDGFRKLLRTVAGEGLVLANGDDMNVRDVLSPVYSRLQLFGKSPNNDWSFNDVEINKNGTSFSVLRQGKKWKRFYIPLFGEYQIYNALTVIAIAADAGLSCEKIQKALSSFLNVKRRLEIWRKLNGALFYNDFAHHPTAIKKTLLALRKKHPGQRIVAIFEPRTNTTVKNIFQTELAEALAVSDTAIITPLHRADRIAKDKRLSLEQLKTDLEKKGTNTFLLPDYKSVFDMLNITVIPGDIAVLMTNGNLGGEYGRLKKIVDEQSLPDKTDV